MYSKISEKIDRITHIHNGIHYESKNNSSSRIILKHGLIIDPKNHVESQMDIAIQGDEICEMNVSILPEKGDSVIECAELQVWPGLIDMHLHIGDLFEITTNSIFCAAEDGVTTGLSPGAGNTFMAPALLGAEMDRGLPISTGVYLGAANILGSMLNTEELIDLFNGKLSPEVAGIKMTRNVITNQTAPFIMGIKDHIGHFILSDDNIEKIFHITDQADLLLVSHTQDPEHAYRMEEMSKGRGFHLGHANAVGCGTHGDACRGMEEIIQLCKKTHITGEFVTTMLRDNRGSREGLKMTKRAWEKARSALADGSVDILVSDGQNQSTMKGFGDTRDNVPCILELMEQGVLGKSKAVATMTSNPARLIANKTKSGVWADKMGHLGKGAYANVTVVDPKKKQATCVIVNGNIASFENRLVRSYGNAGYWVSKFGVTKSMGIGQLSMFDIS